MKRYDVQLANRLRIGEPVLEGFESPTGPYCLVEEVRPLLECLEAALEEIVCEIGHKKNQSHLRETARRWRDEIKAFLA